jgi:hypothetical protein
MPDLWATEQDFEARNGLLHELKAFQRKSFLYYLVESQCIIHDLPFQVNTTYY